MGLGFTNGSGFVVELKLLQVIRFIWTMLRRVEKHARIVYFSVLLRCVKYRPIGQSIGLYVLCD